MFALGKQQTMEKRTERPFFMAVVIVRENRVFFAQFFSFVCFDYTSTGNQPVFFCLQNVTSEAKQLCRLGRGSEPYCLALIAAKRANDNTDFEGRCTND